MTLTRLTPRQPMATVAASSARTQIHVDASVVPKLARLGSAAAVAFDDFVTRARRNGRPAAPAVGALDDKWDARELTSNADVLTWWLASDLAYVWDVVPRTRTKRVAATTQCVVDPRSGTLRTTELDLGLGDLPGAEADVAPATFLRRLDAADLRRIGAPDAFLPELLSIRSPAELERLRARTPEHEALLFGCRLLVRGVPADEVLAAVTRLPENAWDATDHRSALLRSIAGGRIRVLKEETDLAQALEQPWRHWLTYLHPEQWEIAYRKRYGGPTKVTGGPGTGKTIVAVHRVRCLLDQEGGLNVGEPPLLLTSFVTSTVHQLDQLASLLLPPVQRRRVHVTSVDRLAARLLKELPSVQRRFEIAHEGELASRFSPLLREHALDLAPEDAVALWENIVLAAPDPSWRAVRALRQGLKLATRMDADEWEEFLAASRALERSLFAERRTTFLLLLRELVELLPEGAPRYKHVVVDEAQDLHPLHWRLLRRLVPRRANDLFLVGDGGQRLYRRPYALSQCGIELRNRSKVLRTSYRSSKEILDFAEPLLGTRSADDLDQADGQSVARPPARALFSGEWPRCFSYATREAELAAVAPRVRAWQREGIAWGEIMIAASSNALCAGVLDGLDRMGIPGRILSRSTTPSPDAVSIVTYYRAKGLEARAVLVIGAGQTLHAARAPVGDADEADDGAVRLRRALYVACTRGRERLVLTWAGAPNDAVAEALRANPEVKVEIG